MVVLEDVKEIHAIDAQVFYLWQVTDGQLQITIWAIDDQRVALRECMEDLRSITRTMRL